MAFSTKRLIFGKLVYISAIMFTFSNFFEISNSSFNLTLKEEDFEYILSWKAGNSSRMPAYYTVKYRITRNFDCNLHTMGTKSKSAVKQVTSYNSSGKIKSNLKTVQECTNITRPFCNLTNEFADFCWGNAIIIVQQDTSNRISYSNIRHFKPYADRCFRPPQFNISVCQNCVNVTVKLPPLLLKIYQTINYKITVKTADLKEKRIDTTTKQDSFFTIVKDLHPNKKYCIAVEVSTRLNPQCTSTIPKCIMLDSNNRQDYTTLSSLAILILPVAVVIAYLLHEAGYISFKREKSPSALRNPELCELIRISPLIRHEETSSVQGKCFEQDLKQITPEFDSDISNETALKVLPFDNHPSLFAREHKTIKPLLAYLVFESDEEVCDVQVQESKVQQHSDDENSESDVESNFDTKYDIFNQIKPFSGLDITQKIFTGCSAATNEVTRTLAEKNQSDIDKGSPITPLHPSEVNSGHVAESEQTDCLSVNLNTVKLGISDKKLDFSTFDHEDILDLNESSIPDAFEPNRITEMPDGQSSGVQNPPGSWENLSVSGESESSYSETECTSGYMRR